MEVFLTDSCTAFKLQTMEIFFFVVENSKLLITKESKSGSKVPSKIYKVEPSSGNVQY